MSVFLFATGADIFASSWRVLWCSKAGCRCPRLVEVVVDVGVGPRLNDHLRRRVEADLLEEVAETHALDELADALAVLAVLGPEIPHRGDELLDVLVRSLHLDEGHEHRGEERSLDDGALGAEEEGAAAA